MSLTIETIIKSKVRNSTIYAVAFSNIPTDTLTIDDTRIREFIIPILNDNVYLTDMSVAQLTNQDTGSYFHQGGVMDEVFVGQLANGFSNIEDPITPYARLPINNYEYHYIFIITIDGINERSIRVEMLPAYRNPVLVDEFGYYVIASTQLKIRTYKPNTTIYRISNSGVQSTIETVVVPYTERTYSTTTASQGSIIYSSKPIGLNNDGPSYQSFDPFIHLHIRGKNFTMGNRNATNQILILNHHENTTIKYQVTSTAPITTYFISQKYRLTVITTTGSSTFKGTTIMSDKDVSINMDRGTSTTSVDAMIVYPAAREVIGFSQGSAQYLFVMDTANPMSTTLVTINYQRTNINPNVVHTLTVARNSSVNVTSLVNNLYQDGGVRFWVDDPSINQTVLISGACTGDGDGFNGTMWVPRHYMCRTIVTPNQIATDLKYNRCLLSYKSDATAEFDLSTYNSWYIKEDLQTNGTVSGRGTLTVTYENNSNNIAYAGRNLSYNGYVNKVIHCSDDTIMIHHYENDEQILPSGDYPYLTGDLELSTYHVYRLGQ